jgi:hypothetical protein
VTRRVVTGGADLLKWHAGTGLLVGGRDATQLAHVLHRLVPEASEVGSSTGRDPLRVG